MPELPEVETIRRDLERRLPGVRVTALWTSGIPLRMKTPVDVRALKKAAVGQKIEKLERVGKHLVVRTSGGAFVVHLGMSGRLVVVAEAEPRVAHTHVVWTLEDGRELRFTDPRRFGMVGPLAAEIRSGIEPLGRDLTDERLAELLRGRKRAIKAFLLDQTQVAGLGNIYVCEALFESGIHPAARCDRLTRPRIAALRKAIVSVLGRAVKNRGTTLRDYTDASGARGRNQFKLFVYGREGEACVSCATRIRRTVDGGRSTFFCPRCQRR